MALDILITTNRLANDPEARELIEYLRANSTALNLDDGALYYDFPIYSDYETVIHKPDALLLSSTHGVLAVRFIRERSTSKQGAASIDAIDDSLIQFSSILIGRLLKSPSLRKTLSGLRFDVTPVLYFAADVAAIPDDLNCATATSLQSFRAILDGLVGQKQTEQALQEMRSVVEGAKALTRPKKRLIENPEAQLFGAAISKLEADIANFDQQQRKAALITVSGPQRIRGLAGSGKTVIIAMKAAHLHLTRPDALILVTFNTKSLRATLKNLITRFYRHFRDEDPDWNKIHIRHGWGGATTGGVYSDACRRLNITPLPFGAARQQAMGKEPFDFACRTLLEQTEVQPFYDHILIDEGQDFLSSFYELCYALTKGLRDVKSIVWAYDELQNILDVKLRSPEQLFGNDVDGEPRVSLERSSVGQPPGALNDAVLSKCYRNQREVLVTAHALGFGIYGEIVQLLESREHWQDVGYDVISEGEFVVGKHLEILRPPENNPLSLEGMTTEKLIQCGVFETFAAEIKWATGGIKEFVSGGLQPEDILVIALDDRNSREYLRAMSSALAEEDIQSNNILADPYNEPPFVIAGKVTLSTVYRAKGNEACVVFALGVDAISTKTRQGRNKLFTAFTRTKAWLRVSGIGANASKISAEITAALKQFPYLRFKMPDLQKVELIQRDLGQRNAKAKKIRDDIVKRLKKEGLTDEDIADLFTKEAKDAKT